MSDRKFNLRLYDKHYLLLFSIVRMSYLPSNIPSKITETCFSKIYGTDFEIFVKFSSTCKNFIKFLFQQKIYLHQLPTYTFFHNIICINK